MKNIIFATLFLFSSGICAQTEFPNSSNSSFLSKLEHRIVLGYNIGATAPIPLPGEIRSIDGYWPQFTPQLGYDVTYRFHEKWGVGLGALLDYKGMGAKDHVKSLQTIVDVEVGDELGNFEGYFTGKNKTEVKSAYVTFPIYMSYKLNEKWKFRLGGYVSYKFSSEFSGEVSDGYIRQTDPTGERIDIQYATFNFGDDMRLFDFGAIAGGEYAINKRFGGFANLSWGLNPIFPSSFKGIGYKMYNVYGTLGISYSL